MTTPQDGRITKDELVAFFEKKRTHIEAERKAKHWLKLMDGCGDNSGYIDPVGLASSQ